MASHEKKKIYILAYNNYHSQKTCADLWVQAFDKAGVNSHVMM